MTNHLLRFLLFIVICFSSGSIVFAQLTGFPAGKIDRTFATGGIAPIGGAYSFGGYALQLPDKKVVCMGTSLNHIRITRSNPDGQLDPTFGTNGVATFSFEQIDIGISISALPNGDILVAGATSSTVNFFGSLDFLVFRIDRFGNLDTSFGTNGSLKRDFAPAGTGELSDDQATSAIGLPDGKILIGGTATRYTTLHSRGNTFSIIQRLTADGTTDDTFGKQGTSQLAIGNNVVGDHFASPQVVLALDPNGKTVAALNCDRLAGADYQYEGELARFLPDGSLDASFGKDGRLLITFPNSPTPVANFRFQPDGSFMANIPFAIISVTPKGTLDTNFANSGFLMTGTWTSDFWVQDNGRIVVTGGDTGLIPGLNRQVGWIKRFFPDGTKDIRFGISGRTLFWSINPDVDFQNPQIGLGPIYPSEYGKILVVGGFFSNGGSVLFLTRFIIAK